MLFGRAENRHTLYILMDVRLGAVLVLCGSVLRDCKYIRFLFGGAKGGLSEVPFLRPLRLDTLNPRLSRAVSAVKLLCIQKKRMILSASHTKVDIVSTR
jgi:hypothetical protein